MPSTHETISDHSLLQLYFSTVITTDQLLAPHWHEHLEILAVTKGHMTAYIGETTYELYRGDVLVINPEDIHYTRTHEDCHYFLLQIPPSHLEHLSSRYTLLRFREYLPASDNPTAVAGRCFSLVQSIGRHYDSKKDGSHLLCLSDLYRLLYLLYTEASTRTSAEYADRNSRDFERVRSSMDYVRRHYSEAFALSDLAEELAVTPEHFCRTFKKCTGQTFFTYVSQIRMQHFYQDLTQSGDSINDLLEKNGIRNYKGFLRDFKRLYHATPGQVRKQLLTESQSPDLR